MILEHLQNAKRWRVLFGVRRSRPAAGFPLDMLRFEACTFLREHDANRAARMVAPGSDDNEMIALVTWTVDDGWQPTRARWQSFGWDVVSVGEFKRLMSERSERGD